VKNEEMSKEHFKGATRFGKVFVLVPLLFLAVFAVFTPATKSLYKGLFAGGIAILVFAFVSFLSWLRKRKERK
jgi:protein-S-isoprenylcysteine O-methyltransferase Ste14